MENSTAVVIKILLDFGKCLYPNIKPLFLDLCRATHSKSSSLRRRRGTVFRQIARAAHCSCLTRGESKNWYYCHCLNVIAGNKQRGEPQALKKNQETSFGEVKNLKALRRGSKWIMHLMLVGILKHHVNRQDAEYLCFRGVYILKSFCLLLQSLLGVRGDRGPCY